MKNGGEMREVGTLKAHPLARFGRNQRRAAKLAPRTGQRSGVMRFRTWEEHSQWLKSQPAGT